MGSTGNTYHPETYWNEVAGKISGREDGHFIAGDDEPYYRYKRKKFLRIFHTIDLRNKKVMEVGCGPGGNLLLAAEQDPSRLVGADLSGEMLSLAEKNLAGKNVELALIRDHSFPFADNTFDIVFTSTVLQHTTSDADLAATVAEMCRVSKSDVYIFERIEKKIKGNESCLGRTVDFYEQLFLEHDFVLVKKKFLFIQASYVMAGLTRKLFNSKKRREGESLTKLSIWLQRIMLPVTKMFDKIVKAERDLAMLHFKMRGNG